MSRRKLVYIYEVKVSHEPLLGIFVVKYLNHTYCGGESLRVEFNRGLPSRLCYSSIFSDTDRKGCEQMLSFAW